MQIFAIVIFSSKDAQKPETPYISRNFGLFHVARQKGLEPLTYWFVASYSIQLSYCRVSVALADDYCMIT